MEKSHQNHPRETGKTLHRRETWQQITIPFLLGLALLLAIFLLVGIPNNSDWRLRAEAITSLLYSWFCLMPMILCLFIPYIIIVLGIYAMRLLHSSTERPLRRVETFAEDIAKRINKFGENIDDKADAFDQPLAPLYRILGIFDEPQNPEEEIDEPGKQAES